MGKKREDKNKDRVGSEVGEEAAACWRGGGVGDVGEEAARKNERRGSSSGSTRSVKMNCGGPMMVLESGLVKGGHGGGVRGRRKPREGVASRGIPFQGRSMTKREEGRGRIEGKIEEERRGEGRERGDPLALV